MKYNLPYTEDPISFRLLIIFLILLSVSSVFPQEEKVVAKVGSCRISESEFRERFDFSVHPGLLRKSDKDKVKHEFLKQLIAEKLLSLEARGKGLDTTGLFRDIITPLENMFVRDALYKIEIKNKTVISDKEISEGIERISRVLRVKFIQSKSREELDNIYDLLTAGASFDSLLALRKEADDNPREITFGTMDKEIEDVVYRLKPGEFTNPLESGDGFYILKLIETGSNTDLKSPELTLDDVKRIVETRAERRKYLEYYRNFFSKFKVTADKEIFEDLVGIFLQTFKKKYHDHVNDEKVNKYFLRGTEVSYVYEKLDTEEQEKIFIDIGEKPVRVKYFLNQLSQEGFYVKDPGELSIRASLSSYIRKFIEDQLLTIEGIKKGLNRLPDVENYMNMWEEAYLSKMLMVNMFDSIKVSEEEAFSVYKMNDWKDTPPALVNIAEVLTDDLNVVENVLNELTRGRSIKELAEQYTKRDSLKNRGGEFGFFPVSEHGEIGRIASQMEIGDVYGPLKLDEGYSVFQLIDRKTDTTRYSKSYEEVREELISHLTLLKFEKYVNEYNARLARKYGVEINEDVLRQIDNIFMNLVVVRYMGFGGEILAVPYTEQYSGWYEIWKQSGTLNP